MSRTVRAALLATLAAALTGTIQPALAVQGCSSVGRPADPSFVGGECDNNGRELVVGCLLTSGALYGVAEAGPLAAGITLECQVKTAGGSVLVDKTTSGAGPVVTFDSVAVSGTSLVVCARATATWSDETLSWPKATGLKCSAG
jgi:hypothetical protein